MSNDIYMQIALIMLMGLLAKNAILIVEFALDRRKQGMSISWAAVLGAAARLRPILMTSLAMIVGLIPLMLAMGVASPMAGGIRVLRSGLYQKKIALAAVSFGTLGALVGTAFTVSLDATTLSVILLVIMAITAVTMLRPKKQTES